MQTMPSRLQLQRIATDTQALMIAAGGEAKLSPNTWESPKGLRANKRIRSDLNQNPHQRLHHQEQAHTQLQHPFPNLLESLQRGSLGGTDEEGLTASDFRLWDTILPQSALCPDVAALFDQTLESIQQAKKKRTRK